MKEYTFYALGADGREHIETNLTIEESNALVEVHGCGRGGDAFLAGTYSRDCNLEGVRSWGKKHYGVEL